jgi:lipoprotein signal peptidase
VNDHRHLTLLSRIALLVTAGDLATKAAASELLGTNATIFAPWLHLAVVHNDAGAFGWSVGAYTWQLNLALTLAAIVFVIPVTRDLARIDASAPHALGLIVGGALGNLASLITSPHGVVDFIQINLQTSGIALNVADVAAYAGLAMIVRTGVLLVAALRREARLREPAREQPVVSVFAERAQLVRRLQPERPIAVPEPMAAHGAADVVVHEWGRVLPFATLADSPPSADEPIVLDLPKGVPAPARGYRGEVRGTGDASRAPRLRLDGSSRGVDNGPR